MHFYYLRLLLINVFASTDKNEYPIKLSFTFDQTTFFFVCQKNVIFWKKGKNREKEITRTFGFGNFHATEEQQHVDEEGNYDEDENDKRGNNNAKNHTLFSFRPAKSARTLYQRPCAKVGRESLGCFGLFNWNQSERQ